MLRHFASLIIGIDSFKYIIIPLMLKAATPIGISIITGDLDLISAIS